MSGLSPPSRSDVATYAPMKRGLKASRTPIYHRQTANRCSNLCPDEKGTESPNSEAGLTPPGTRQ